MTDAMITRKWWSAAAGALAVLSAVLFLTVSVAHAQFGGIDSNTRLFLSVIPEYPGPNELARVTLQNPLMDLSVSDITWYVNNKVFARGAGMTAAGIPVGPLGSRTNISATAQTPDGFYASGNASIAPAEVDLLWESDSYTPPFYRGRALPSAGAGIRAQAIARFKTAGSLQLSERDIVYTWKRNGSVVPSLSGRGMPSAFFPAPALFGTDIVEAVASTIDGGAGGAARAEISSIEPVLALYEDNPLSGIMYNNAIDDTESLSDTEATFAAVPYFAEAESPDDPRLIYSWSVNGKKIPTDELKRSEITVNSANSNGLAQIALSLTHASNLAMSASGAWRVSFASGEGGFRGFDPFPTPSE